MSTAAPDPNGPPPGYEEPVAGKTENAEEQEMEEVDLELDVEFEITPDDVKASNITENDMEVVQLI